MTPRALPTLILLASLLSGCPSKKDAPRSAPPAPAAPVVAPAPMTPAVAPAPPAAQRPPRPVLAPNEQVEALVTRLNDAPHPRLVHRTPAVDELIELGLPIIPYLEQPLQAEGMLTRLRAQAALHGVAAAFVSSRDSTTPETPAHDRAMEVLWAANGAYDFEGSAGQRRDAAEAWTDWARAQRP
jgi:hypothetical protein